MEIKFNPETEKAELKRMMKATDAYIALWEIAQQVFRPARKHGYSQPNIQKLLDETDEAGYELVGELEQLFYQLLEDKQIDIHLDLE